MNGKEREEIGELVLNWKCIPGIQTHDSGERVRRWPPPTCILPTVTVQSCPVCDGSQGEMFSPEPCFAASILESKSCWVWGHLPAMPLVEIWQYKLTLPCCWLAFSGRIFKPTAFSLYPACKAFANHKLIRGVLKAIVTISINKCSEFRSTAFV